MKLEVSSGVFLLIAIFFIFSGLFFSINSQIEIGLMMLAGGAIGLFRYVINKQKTDEEIYQNQTETSQKISFPSKSDQTQRTKSDTKPIYPRYQIIWWDSVNAIKQPVLLDEKDIKELQVGIPTKYYEFQFTRALIFIYGSPNLHNEITNNRIEDLMREIAVESIPECDLDQNPDLDSIVSEICYDEMQECAEAFGKDFMLVYNIGAFKLTGDKNFRRFATIDLYNLLVLEIPTMVTRIGDDSIYIETNSFSINANKNVIHCKDRRMQYAVNVILQESLIAGLPDFDNSERENLMKTLNIIYSK